MIFSKVRTLAAVALAMMAMSFVEASPIPAPAVPNTSVKAYVPVRERVYTAEQLTEHETLLKRSSAGLNDWSCKPSASHPVPLILVHGLLANAVDNWIYMGPRFAAAGYCTYALTYGQLNGIPFFAGLDKMENSAQELSAFVNKVLASTGASKVDLVGHSEGTLMPRYYLKFLGGAAKVRKYGGFGAIVTGTTLDGLYPFLDSLGLYDTIQNIIDPVCLSCFEFLEGSDFLTNLNAGGESVPGVEYRFVVSEMDEVVTPYTNGFITDKNPLVQNVVLQNLCSVDLSDHVLQMVDPIVFHEMDAFLNPQADQTVNCLSALY